MTRAVRTLVVLLAVVVTALAGAAAAQAHTSLVRSNPGDGETLSSPPTAIVLTFAESVLPEGAGIAATADDGTKVSLGRPAVSGAKVSAPWPEGTPGGTYKVSWRVVADDGHPVTGSFTFSYAASSPSPSPSATSASPSATSAAPVTPTPSASPSAAPAPASDGGGRTIAVVLALLAAVAAVGVVVVALRRRGDSG